MAPYLVSQSVQIMVLWSNGPTPGVTICSNNGSVGKNGPTLGVTISSNNGSVVKNGPTSGVTVSSIMVLWAKMVPHRVHNLFK